MHVLASPAAMLRIVNIPPAHWRHQIESTPKLIGRSPEADIQVPAVYETVSLRHAEIVREDDVLQLCDLGSSSGTWVNGVPLTPHRPTCVIIGDDVWLGDLQLRIERWSAASPDRDQQPPRPAADLCSTRASGERLKRLSGRELDIVMWLRRGYTDDGQVSRVLQRSRHTIRTQVSNILQKLDLPSRSAIIVRKAPPAMLEAELSISTRRASN